MRQAEPTEHLRRLVTNIEWALEQGLPASELVPMFRRLLRDAPPGSDAACFAKRSLSELLVQREPWRAALLAREVLSQDPDHRTWGVLGIAQTLLGNYRCAAAAYRKALLGAPDDPGYSHNLGHLLDVAMNRPRDALHYLRKAHLALPDEPEIASSYAHALARSGQRMAARETLASALCDEQRAEQLLRTWLAENAVRMPSQDETALEVVDAAPDSAE